MCDYYAATRVSPGTSRILPTYASAKHTECILHLRYLTHIAHYMYSCTCRDLAGGPDGQYVRHHLQTQAGWSQISRHSVVHENSAAQRHAREGG